MDAKFDKMNLPRNGDQGEPFSASSRATLGTNGVCIVVPKLTRSYFLKYMGGEDKASWICCVEQFFEFQQSIPKEQASRATCEGEAQLWYQLEKEDGQLITWPLVEKGSPYPFQSYQLQRFW